jgi:exodeoxyribonuclease V gamma subunit
VLACHGALRQVEVLKDALLRAFDQDPTLQPRDVVILTPDPARFVPLLQAIFPLTHARDAANASGAERDTRSHDATPALGLHVQGRSPRATNPVADIVIRLLSLADERASASRVLDLVERGPVAEAFGLTPADAPVIRGWMHEAGVRWGIDATDPQRDGLGLHDEGTWRRGLTRVLLGVAMHDESRSQDQADVHLAGHAPVAGLEGERAELAGRVSRAVRLILDLLVAARTPRRLNEWVEWTDTALRTLVSHSGAAALGAARLRDIMTALAGDAETVRVRGTLAAAAVAQLLEHRMEDVLIAPGQLGGITVAPLVAGWVRPARIIALLGMDDELFPRRGGAPWFDKLIESPMLGDPDDRGEQLQTVFDALMQTSEQLLITYTGWNKAGTMRLPPSVAIGAIAEAVHDAVQIAEPDADCDTAWRTLVEREMPLQPFSARAFATGDAASDVGRAHAPDNV